MELVPGDRVLVQNQSGTKPKRWDRSGVVVEVKPHGQHLVRVDGSRRVTLRNRQFLRRVEQLQAADRGMPAPPAQREPEAGMATRQLEPERQEARVQHEAPGRLEAPERHEALTHQMAERHDHVEGSPGERGSGAAPAQERIAPVPGVAKGVSNERDPPVPNPAPGGAEQEVGAGPPRRSSRVSCPPQRLNMTWDGASYVSSLANECKIVWDLQ